MAARAATGTRKRTDRRSRTTGSPGQGKNRMRMKRWLPLVGMLCACAGLAQSNEDCLDCHNDDTLTMEKGDREVSLHLNPQAFQDAAHSDLDCVDCHEDYDPEADPHRENAPPVDCSACHEDEVRQFRESRHADALTCADCHNVHVQETGKTVAAKCAACHETAQKEFQDSIHARREAGPLCFDCHPPHATAPPTSENCLTCHSQKEFVHEHAPGKGVKFILSYKESIHADLIECSDCHNGHSIVAVDSEQSAVNRKNLVRTCQECHEDTTRQFLKSEHGRAYQAGYKYGPTCTDCHGEHDIHQITDRQSPVSRRHEAEVCQHCHLDSPEVRQRMTHDAGFVADYEKSIHGRAVKAGNLEAAVCSDCHGGHDELKSSAPDSKVYKFNIVDTCGKCHEKIARQFAESIHGQALARGVWESPTCTDCHGEHGILEHTQTDSPVAPQNVSEQVCGPCHGSVKLTEKFGISSSRYEAYNDSYHGLATRGGSIRAANCASCHGIHNILPSSDPRSNIHKANLVKTCGNCHPGANENFTEGKVHITGTLQDDRLIYWISTIYLILIAVTIGSMLGHNLLDWLRKTGEQYRRRYGGARASTPPPSGAHLYLRMTRGERIQHFLLVISFFTLVLTGFMLKFPDAFWVFWIRQWGGEMLFTLRGLLHRLAAVVMIVDSLYHVYYLAFTPRGRRFLKDMRFGPRDFKDMIQMLRYNLGLSPDRPRFDRFNYIEKSEYWALVWGTIIMTVTGVALWYENHFMGWFSKQFVDVCETIHYFEAWLAFLAILVWHLYYVIFNPDVYPLNFACLNGRLTEEEMAHEHPRELERLKKARADETAGAIRGARRESSG